MHRSVRCSALLIALSASALAAGADFALPLDAVGSEPALSALRYQTSHARVDALASLPAVALDGLSLPDGRALELDLVRLRPERLGFRYFVDGAPRADLLDGLGLTIWKGSVRGAEHSDVMLSFSHLGAQGWIQLDGELIHLMARPDANGNWWNAETLVTTESALNAAGLQLDGDCNAQRPPRTSAEEREASGASSGASQSGTPPSSGLMGPGCSLLECKVSLETDFQYFQKFNDLGAQTVYTTTLWTYISSRYESQVNTVLTFPYVAFYTASNDPWTTPDAPGTSSAMLTEFRNAWTGNVPNGGRVGHFMSGAALGGGVAWLDTLCANDYNFGVSGNINSLAVFPIVPASTNWDFMVCAHELGHNFSAPHTHDYCPPLDQCAPSGYFGSCQTQQVCTNQGTIMSYCHLCSGGTANITTYFHTQSAADMSARAASCLPAFVPLTGSAVALVPSNTPTPVAANVHGTPVGTVKLFVRALASQSFVEVAMTPAGNGVYNASLPGFNCSDAPQYYYEFTDAACGTVRYPASAPTSVLSAAVGVDVTYALDDFQTDQGWVASNLGATAGDWQRGVPVNDPSWAYDPTSDGDGSGACWLTQNTVGNSDVDGGSVRLTSPLLDLSQPGSGISYRYFLRLTVANGADALVAELSNNGASGPWIEIARHNQDLGLAWASHTISHASLASLGVTFTSNTRVRFTANDGGAASVVEAGLDAFELGGVTCSGIGANYCTSTLNSSGGAALISASGSNSLAAGDLVLSATPVPNNTNGLYFFSANAVQVPFGNGVKCVGGPVVRLPLGAASGTTLSAAVNSGVPQAAPHLAVGSTWHFQAWFRDAAGGGSNYNLSDGYRITFQP
ncbi:MAG: hypothetical protein IT454_06595 [Planctomycetes bacterium]|nr:hypothetical protein [Planctomycetota bacterium]